MKLRAGVRITYEGLMSAIGLEDHKLLRIVSDPKAENSEYIDIITEGPGGWLTPEGGAVAFTDIETLRIRVEDNNAKESN